MTVGAISETVEVRADTPLLESKTAAQTGADRFRGSCRVSIRAKDWNADNTPDGQSLTVTTRQADFSLGGPIVRGDAWFFGTARIARNATGNPQSAQQASYLRPLQPGYTPLDNDILKDVQCDRQSRRFRFPCAFRLASRVRIAAFRPRCSAADTRRRALLSYREVV